MTKKELLEKLKVIEPDNNEQRDAKFLKPLPFKKERLDA